MALAYWPRGARLATLREQPSTFKPWPWPIGHAGRVWPRYANNLQPSNLGLGLLATRGAFGHATRTTFKPSTP
ncbi:hypothetical protein [Moorena sp. SIO3F7]|uniref:hypothetical protein n=1 Tax=Moorena sp. SIO3F7 TaxID=2607839 RepID=UPI0013FE9E1D|nr:hypothetical protein [Moorena sp. SIO3F7]NEQ02963.1 hypothetical protein [Moorena sp. SIO3F7]